MEAEAVVVVAVVGVAGDAAVAVEVVIQDKARLSSLRA